MNKYTFLFCCLFVVVMSTSCQSNQSNSQYVNDATSDVSNQEIDLFSAKNYISYQEAYRDIIEELQKKQEGFLPLQDIERTCLYDIDGNGQDKLLCVYVGGVDTLYCAVWTFDDGKAILLIDDKLASLAGIGTGGLNLVEYEGTQYICGWAYNSAPWEPGEANIYYDCFLWEVPKSNSYFEFPLKYPSHTFAFRYYLTEDNDINSTAFSFLEDDHIALSIDKFKELKNVLLDNPIQTLCEANIIHSKGLSFNEMLSSLQS